MTALTPSILFSLQMRTASKIQALLQVAIFLHRVTSPAKALSESSEDASFAMYASAGEERHASIARVNATFHQNAEDHFYQSSAPQTSMLICRGGVWGVMVLLGNRAHSDPSIREEAKRRMDNRLVAFSQHRLPLFICLQS